MSRKLAPFGYIVEILFGEVGVELIADTFDLLTNGAELLADFAELLEKSLSQLRNLVRVTGLGR